MQSNEMMNTSMAHMHMGVLTPTGGLPRAKEPKYTPNSHVQIIASHMKGMEGARGTVVGAYACTAYAVDVTADTGEILKDHKWVIADEIKDGKSQEFSVGDRVQLARGHIAEMVSKNAEATIAEVHAGPVYMIDYTPADGGQPVRNHQWVVEDELQADTATRIIQ